MVKIAVVGSRTFRNYGLLKTTMNGFSKPFIVVSGGAAGADSLAERYAREAGLPTEVYPADWARHGRAAGMIRNKQIVDAADHVVAFWDGRSRGTANTIDRARSAGKLLTVVQF